MLKRIFGIIAVAVIVWVVVMVAITPSKSLCFKNKNVLDSAPCDTLPIVLPLVEKTDSMPPAVDSIF